MFIPSFVIVTDDDIQYPRTELIVILGHYHTHGSQKRDTVMIDKHADRLSGLCLAGLAF